MATWNEAAACQRLHALLLVELNEAGLFDRLRALFESASAKEPGGLKPAQALQITAIVGASIT